MISKINKRGQGFEAFFIVIIVLLAFGLFFLVLNKVWGEVSEPLSEGLNSSIPENDSNLVMGTINNTGSVGVLFDSLIPFIIIGLFAFVFILAGGIMKHPLMIFVGVIILGVIVLLATIYSNVYNEISSTDEFSNTKADLPIQDIFMHYLPIIIFAMSIIIIILILWGRGSSGGYSGV